jgi:hypothetical protein
MGTEVKMRIDGPKILETYHGVQLQSIETHFDLASVQASVKVALDRMYGEKMHMVMAIFDKKFALAIGKNADQELKNLVDRIQQKSPGFTASESFVNAAGGLNKNAGGFFTISVSQIISSSLQSSLVMLGRDSSSIKISPSKSALFIAFQSKPEKLTATLRLPSEHLKEIGDTIKVLTQLSEP